MRVLELKGKLAALEGEQLLTAFSQQLFAATNSGGFAGSAHRVWGLAANGQNEAVNLWVCHAPGPACADAHTCMPLLLPLQAKGRCSSWLPPSGDTRYCRYYCSCPLLPLRAFAACLLPRPSAYARPPRLS
jgi:hypothetical protein